MKPTDETFIVQLTVEQLVDILKQEFPLLTLTKADLQPPKKEEKKKRGSGMGSMPLGVQAQSPNHWTTWQVPIFLCY